MVIAIIGILVAIAVPNLLTAIQRAKQKTTMSNMRNIATAWEARAADFSQYNAAGGFNGANVSIPITDVSALLIPTYIRSIPSKDGWGHPLDCFMDADLAGTTVAQRYAISSPGRDGKYSTPFVPGAFSNYDCDIVYSNGAFLSYPSGN